MSKYHLFTAPLILGLGVLLGLTSSAQAGVSGKVYQNQGVYYPQQDMVIHLELTNDGPAQLADAYLVLESAGKYYYYPDFSETPTSHLIKITEGTSRFEVLSGRLGRAATDFGVSWHLALTEPGTTSIISYEQSQSTVRAALGAEFLPVAAGEFTRGLDNPSGDVNIQDEAPKRDIWLDSYFINKYEVSNGDYAQFMAGDGTTGGYDNPLLWSKDGWEWKVDNGIRGPVFWFDSAAADFNHGPNPAVANYPVAGVSFYEVQAYCKFNGVRLPSEAEWEKAARGTDERDYPWGRTLDCDVVNYEACGSDGTVPVDSMPNGASPYGALHMAGNVWEWVQDWYNPNYYDPNNGPGYVTPDANPQGPFVAQNYKGWRGGSWVISQRAIPLRVTNRFGGTSSDHGASLTMRYIWSGFRTAADGDIALDATDDCL